MTFLETIGTLDFPLLIKTGSIFSMVQGGAQSNLGF